MKLDDELPRVEYRGICLRVTFLIFGILGAVFSILAMGGCDFFKYNPSDPPDGISDNRDPDVLHIKSATIGLFKYDPNYEGCRDISDDFDDLTWQFTAAQVCATVAAILSIVALVLVAVDFLLCRFPCSRIMIAFLFLFAFICQTLSMLVYVARVCEPNFVNGPYPCTPDTGTWLATVAVFCFLIGCFMACCIPKPVPVFMRVKKNQQESDGCCYICAKKKAIDEEAADEEKGEESTAEGEEEEEEIPMTPEEQKAYVEKLKTCAMVTTALTTARKGKLEEIEKELVTLEKYKEHMSEEEYNERVTALMMALPSPGTYEVFTKTEDLVVLEEEVVEEEEAVEEEDGGEVEGEEGVEGEGEQEQHKKGFIGATGAAISGGATATAAAIKRPFTKGKKSEEPYQVEAPAGET